MNLMTKDDLKRFEDDIIKEINQELSKLPNEEQYRKAISEGLKESGVVAKSDIDKEFSSLNRWAKVLFFLSFISMTLTWILSIMVK